MAGALSGLTTRGRCLLAAGMAAALCSVVLNERDLLRVAAFVIALPLLAALFTARIQVGISAERSLAPVRVPVGDTMQVTVRVRNRSMRASGLNLEDGVPAALGGRPRFAVDRLRRGGTAALNYRLRPALRGVHQVGPLLAKVSDPFGLAEFDRSLPVYSRLLVVPKVVPFSGVPSGSGDGTGVTGSVRRHAGHGEDDVVVRPYRHGDDLRKVHWRSTAHRDELMVRMVERPWRGGTTVLLDHRADAHRGAGAASSLEWAISFVASACVHLHRFDQPIRLVTEDGGVLSGGDGHGQRAGGYHDEAVLDALAALQPTHRRDLGCITDPGADQELVAVLGALTPVAASELASARPRGIRSLAVLLDTGSWDEAGEEQIDPNEAAALLRGSGWSVIVARQSDPMPAVWSRLTKRSGISDPLPASDGALW